MGIGDEEDEEDEGDEGDEEDRIDALCPMPNAQCPMPYIQYLCLHKLLSILVWLRLMMVPHFW
ncbi:MULTISPECIES: hypothetical protein [unclassified Tolypothrix]|uniref:hypothetical protein n=1 Tax=unclassified Tolypothrix TaxID=2649714 RepID=UPI001AF027DB|nr:MULTISPECIES: hypothetical protein [unclassified Tolypothrix]UYD23599.1 hypothetical protein HGR01_18965 [Tolypothrix sp. PCC 7712]UYD34173.1 hypothetical protein HG267_35805 [Tolypothrix sp. PCC 7601]